MIRNKQHKQLKQLKQQKKHSQPTEQTFLEHIYELRKRLFWIVFAIVVASAVGLQYKDWLMGVVTSPLHGEKLVYLTPAGGFSFIFTLSIYFGVLIAIPVIIYHIYRFIEPMLGGASRKFVAGFIGLSVGLASLGAAFGYFVTIPAALGFLSEFAGDVVIPNLTAESYLNFVVTYILGLAFLFQVPLLLFLFDHVKSIPPGNLTKSQRYVIIAATVIAAIITPTPDAFNMMLVAVPLVLVYELGVVAVFIRHRSAHARSAKKIVMEAAQVKAVIPELLPEQENSAIPAFVVSKTHTVKTVDGVMRVRPAVPTVSVPARTTAHAELLAEQRRAAQRPGRTIDGFFVLDTARSA